MGQLLWEDLQFCLRVLPQRILEVLCEYPGRVFVAGGFIRSTISGTPVNDIDLIVDDKELAQTVTAFLLEESFEAGVDKGHIWVTDNAYTVRRWRTAVQVVHRWTYSNPTKMLLSFDFTIASAGLWMRHTEGEQAALFGGPADDFQKRERASHAALRRQPGWTSMCHPRYYADLAAKRLAYMRPMREEEAGGSLLRVVKFLRRGYNIAPDHLAMVMSRVVQEVHPEALPAWDEAEIAPIITAKLREVDPLMVEIGEV